MLEDDKEVENWEWQETMLFLALSQSCNKPVAQLFQLLNILSTLFPFQIGFPAIGKA